MEDNTRYLSGEKLFGDDFTIEEIEKWYRDEKEGYADLGAGDKSSYKYSYHALNRFHGFKYIRNRKFKNVLGLGSAYGDEFLPIIDNVERLTIIDPSDSFKLDKVHGVPCAYVKPAVDGKLPFEGGIFDLVVCLGVLHHIPNVSTVMNELYRCLSHGGALLVREPIISMGDWRRPRPGLTKRERGIPIDIFRNIVKNAGFEVTKESLCMFPLIPRLYQRFGVPAYNSSVAVLGDALLSQLFRWNIRYNATRFIHKFRPVSVYYVLLKHNKQIKPVEL